MADVGTRYALTGTAVTITSVLPLTEKKYVRQLSVKNAKGAANNVYLGGSGVTAAGVNARVELDANQGYTWGPFPDMPLMSTDDLFIIGTVGATNLAFIDLVYFTPATSG